MWMADNDNGASQEYKNGQDTVRISKITRIECDKIKGKCILTYTFLESFLDNQMCLRHMNKFTTVAILSLIPASLLMAVNMTAKPASAGLFLGDCHKLKNAGLNVVAVQLPLHTLADDVTTVKRAIEHIGGPTILVGHSYGGEVISNAGYNNPN